ncbi:MAG TPA: tRNA preQ1(34) S-adenosylmethionine ribosyltransferase-isomerase QueA [Candidatus Marinimicrobia bacterium]|nr:tRNA preQ1(34) S-adenosylmethionine ribosyltransferase-isomerase QueA [Candidatus Neomarinimicrobiota bacterium]
MTKFEIFNTKPKTYRLSDFDYELPEQLIAQFPSEKRGDSKMLLVNRQNGEITHKKFTNVIDFINPEDVLVINNTKVFPARMVARKDKTDAEVEVFLLRELENQIWEVLVKPARKVRIGNKLYFTDELYCDVIDNTVSGGRVVRHNCDPKTFMDYVMQEGKSPLPPYIKRDSKPIDKERYQTVFAEKLGAVAAPTAGLHFNREIINAIQAKGVAIVTITLHIGLGTFRAVQVEDLNRHNMDSEHYTISQETADIINARRAQGGRCIAVGTSTIRALESSTISDDSVNPQNSWTDKFIFPPYNFQVVDAMITNFHQPKSTLMMLVSAFASRDLMMKAYSIAIHEKYYFFSYGDAMMII